MNWQLGDHDTYRLPPLYARNIPFPDMTRDHWRILNHAKTVAKIARTFPPEAVPIDKIVPVQNWVHQDNVDRLAETPELIDKARQPAIGVRFKDIYFLHDGHHRLVASILSQRDFLEIRVVLAFD